MTRESGPNARRYQRSEGGDSTNPYAVIAGVLRTDTAALFAYSRGEGPLDEELVRRYELRPDDLPELTLPNSLDFVGGFSYVSGQWYPLIRAIATHQDPTPAMIGSMDAELAHLIPDGIVTTQTLREALQEDPSGATWLEQRARVEFRQGNLELIGAMKAITGVRKMFAELTA